VFLGRIEDGRHVWAVRGPLEAPDDPDLKAEVAGARQAGQLFDDVGRATGVGGCGAAELACQ